jgi:hypothetical protein
MRFQKGKRKRIIVNNTHEETFVILGNNIEDKNP